VFAAFCSGCTEPNDVVTDTPEMANPQFDCVAVNSCPNRPSGQGTTDPIHNIMVRPRSDVSACSSLPAIAAVVSQVSCPRRKAGTCRVAVSLDGLADERFTYSQLVSIVPLNSFHP